MIAEPGSRSSELIQSEASLLERFIYSFYGYGNYRGQFWFIGMEEGGGGSWEEVKTRVHTWDARGDQEIEDVKSYHTALRLDKFFKDPVILQPTWTQLIRVYLAANGSQVETDSIKSFQKDRIGRSEEDTCLLELMPLPSPRTNQWSYSEWSCLLILRSREDYINTMLPMRMVHIRGRINEYHPRCVVFYGKAYWKYWEEMIGTQVEWDPSIGYGRYKNNSSIFLIIKHPASRGITNDYFFTVGKILLNELNG